jgi:hypothetical protein
MFSTVPKLAVIFGLFFIVIFSPIYLIGEANLDYPIADDASYISHAFSIGLDLDLNYENEVATDFSANKRLPTHPIGSGLLSAPFIRLFSLIDRAIDHPVISNHKNFLNSWSYFGFLFSVNVYFLLGIIFNLKSIRLLNIINNDLWLIVLGVLSSGIPYYVLVRFPMSVVFEFFTNSILLWSVIKIYYSIVNRSDQFKWFILYTLSLSLCFFVRYNNFNLFLLGPIVFLIIFIYLDNKKTINLNKILIWFIVMGIVSYIPVMIFNYIMLDTFFIKPSDLYVSDFGLETQSIFYITTSFIKSLTGLFNINFGSEMGLLYSSPYITIGSIALFFIVIKKMIISNTKYLIHLFVLLLLMFFYGFGNAISLWNSDPGSSYSWRYILHCFPISLLGIVIMFNSIKQHYNTYFRRLIIMFSIISIISLTFFSSTDDLSLKKQINTFNVEKIHSGNNYMLNLPGEIMKPYNWVKCLGQSFTGLILYPYIIDTEIVSKFNKDDLVSYNKRYKDVKPIIYFQSTLLFIFWIFMGYIINSYLKNKKNIKNFN